MITDPYEIHFNEKRQMYYVQQGNETFYDKDNNWIMFKTKHGAQNFIDNLCPCDNDSVYDTSLTVEMGDQVRVKP